MSLTNIDCKNFQPEDKPYKKKDERGMFLLVNPTGSKLWRLKYRYAGKEKLLSLGAYPEVSLLEAREKRDEARKLLRDGIDPSEARKDDKRQKIVAASNTFELVAKQWHENTKNRWTERHAANLLNRLEMDLFPSIGRRPISDIKPPELLEVIRKIEARGAIELAHRAYQMSGRIFYLGDARLLNQLKWRLHSNESQNLYTYYKDSYKTPQALH